MYEKTKQNKNNNKDNATYSMLLQKPITTNTINVTTEMSNDFGKKKEENLSEPLTYCICF